MWSTWIRSYNTCRETLPETYVVSVGGHGRSAAQLAVEEDAVLAEDVSGDPHLPPVPGLHHHVVVTSGLLQATAVLVAPVALLSVPKYISNTWGELYWSLTYRSFSRRITTSPLERVTSLFSKSSVIVCLVIFSHFVNTISGRQSNI